MPRKCINLTRDGQKRAFDDARAAVEADDELPDDPTDGEVARITAEAFAGTL